MKVWHYPRCSTCVRALRALASQEPELVDLALAPPDVETLRDLWVRSGLPLRRLFNTAGRSFREGGFALRLASMSEEEQLSALASDGMLVRRPIVDDGLRVTVGWKAPKTEGEKG
jgi:arsenate reductase